MTGPATVALARPDLTLSCTTDAHRVCSRPHTCTCHCHEGSTR